MRRQHHGGFAQAQLLALCGCWSMALVAGCAMCWCVHAVEAVLPGPRHQPRCVRVQGCVAEVVMDDAFQPQGVLVRLEDDTMGHVRAVVSAGSVAWGAVEGDVQMQPAFAPCAVVRQRTVCAGTGCGCASHTTSFGVGAYSMCAPASPCTTSALPSQISALLLFPAPTV